MWNLGKLEVFCRLLDAACYRSNVEAHIDRELAAHPGTVQIENGWRPQREQRPGAIQRGHIREIETMIENPYAEPAMPRVRCQDRCSRLQRERGFKNLLT